MSNTANPRLLSTIEIPRERNCGSDVSDNGRLVYSICDSKPNEVDSSPTGQAKLYIHDISDIRNPKLIHTAEVGKINGWRVVVRNNILFYQQTLGKGITLVDVKEAQRSKVAGHIDTGYNDGFKATEDGRLLGVRAAGNNFSYYDISKPSKPMAISPTATIVGKLVKAPGIWDLSDVPNIQGINGGSFLDMRDGKLFMTDKDNASLFHLYDVTKADQPVRLATFPSPGFRGAWSHIIPTQQAVMFESEKNKYTYQIQLMLAEDAAFSAEHLKSMHEQAQKDFAPCLNPSPTVPFTCYTLSSDIARLRDAGIERLLTETPEGITPGERVLMLNNYGYWLTLPHSGPSQAQLDQAVTALKKVLELSPQRASAWLNLGDAYRVAIPGASPDSEKARMWEEAMASYTRYKQLTGKDAKGMADLAAFNLPEALKSSKNACEYIAKAYNKQKTELIQTATGNAKFNGKMVGFQVGWNGGSCATKSIWAEGCEWSTCYDNEERLRGLSFADGGFGGSVMIVPFRGVFHTSEEEPGEVVAPNSGPVCSLKTIYTPQMVENRDPALCEKFRQGKLKPNVAWTELKGKEIEEADIDLARGYAHFGAVAEASFVGKTKVRVGHFGIESGAGCGCDHYGIALVGTSSMVSSSSEPNASLIDAQGKWWRCGGADADLIQEAGITYVSAWGQDLDGKDTRNRALLRLENGKFEPVCRIEQVKTLLPR